MSVVLSGTSVGVISITSTIGGGNTTAAGFLQPQRETAATSAAGNPTHTRLPATCHRPVVPWLEDLR